MAGEFIPDDAPGQFVPDPEPRSALGEIRAGMARFAPATAHAAAATVAGPQEAAGRPIDAATQATLDSSQKALDENRAQPDQHWGITNAIAGIPEAVGGFLPMAGGQSTGEAAGSIAGPAGVVAGGAAGMAAQQWAQTYHEAKAEAKAAGKSDAEQDAYARDAAGRAAGVGAAFGAIPFVGAPLRAAVGGIAKAAGFGAKTAAQAGAEATSKSYLKEAAKGSAATVAGVSAFGGASGYEQNEARKTAELESTTPLEAAVSGAVGGAEGSPAFIIQALFHAKVAPDHAKAIAAALADPNSSQRAAAVRHVYDAMEKVDPDGANMWAINAGEALHAGAPIGTDASWTEGPHASVFPEAAQPQRALPAPGTTRAGSDVAPDLGDESGPHPLAEQHGNQNAVDDNEARWAARDAAEKARLQASGPLGQAAAAGMDSGAVSHMAEQRAGEVPPGEPPEPPEGGSPQDQQAQANISAWTRSTAPLSLQDAQRNAAAIAEGGKPYTVVPHPQGGYAVVPDHLITPTLAEQFAGLQRAGQLPAPGSDVPGRMTSKEGRTPVATTYGELPPADTAERTRLFPFPTPEAAQNRADAMTMRTGTEHEVIPHPYARDKFAVQEKQSFTEGEQATGANDAVQEPGAEGVLQREPGQAGVGGGERGRVEPGLQGQEVAGEGQATGEEDVVGERLHQNPIAEEHGVAFNGPEGSSKMAIEYGVREMKEPERAATETLLKAVGDAGHDVGIFHGANFTVAEPQTAGDSTKPTNAPLTIFPSSRTIVIRGDLLRAINRGTQLLPQMVGWIRHEGWHLADIKNKAGEFATSTHPAFEIRTDLDGNRTAHGGIMTEAFDAWLKDSAVSEHLNYPFRDWDADYKDMGAYHSHGEWSEVLQNEVFAQLGRLHDMHPDVMKAELPKAYELFERIKDGAKQSDAGDATQRSVQQTLRATGALRGEHVPVSERAEPKDSGRAGRGGTSFRMVRETGDEHSLDETAGERGRGEVGKKDLPGDGRGFTKFFTDATKGGRAPNTGKKYTPVLNISAAKKFTAEYNKHRGNFDDHIATSIPGFREVQQAVGHAIVQTLGEGGHVLDIGASEGSFIKAISAASDGRIKTVGMDPNPAMAKFFEEHSVVPGSRYDMSAFSARAEEGKEAWTEDDGTQIHNFKPDGKFDLAHEAMTFQFISDARDGQVARVKEMLKPGGVAMFEQKFVSDGPEFKANEAKKDAYKAQYYSQEELERKKKDVLERGAEAHAADEAKKEEKIVGMHNLMVTPEAFEKTLLDNFKHVVQYWDSGNFKGYAASDSLPKLREIVRNLGSLHSEYATRETPRRVSENMVNVGLHRNAGKKVTLGEAKAAIEKHGVQIARHEVNDSSTEPTMVASLDKPLTKAQAHQVAVDLGQEAIAQRVNGAGELHGPDKAKWEPFDNKYFLEHTTEFGTPPTIPKEIAKLLTPDELQAMDEGRGRVKKLLRNFNNMVASRFEAAAKAGEAAKEWYQSSLEAIRNVYGDDHRQFLQLMAALSPQTDVKGNFYNAARVWEAWEKAGRTKNRGALMKIFNDNLLTDLGRNDGKMAMAAWTQNGTRVLTADNPLSLRLSGPKVSSFMENLLGNYVEVTNDRHMADFAGIKLDNVKTGELLEKGPAYIALSARVRQAAGKLGWSPAETQAAIWSWWRALKELSSARNNPDGKSALELLNEGALTEAHVKSVPHLGSFMHENEYRNISEDRGRRAGELAGGPRSEDVGQAAEGSSPAGGAVPSRALQAIAKHLDKGGLVSSKVKSINDEYGNPYFVRDADDRNLDEPHPPFYSGMDKAIAAKAPFSKDGKISAQMLRNWLEARTKDGTVKRDEINWTGIDDWLKMRAESSPANDATAKAMGDHDPKIVTSSEVQQFLDQHGVKVEEHVLGESSHDVELWWNDEGGANEEKPYSELSSTERYEAEARYQDEVGNYAEDAVKFGDYQLPGGKNYRELLLTLPTEKPGLAKYTIKEDNGLDGGRVQRVLKDGEIEKTFRTRAEASTYIDGLERDRPQNFRTTHFPDVPNVLAHVRFNERTDANGKKVLFIEELQSDWAQRGRKEGFGPSPAERYKTAIAEATEKFKRAGISIDRTYGTAAVPDKLSLREWEGTKKISPDSLSAELRSAWAGLQNMNAHAANSFMAHHSGVPSAPFVGKTEAWTALALKRMIRYAADNGFDRVAWTNGEQQAARYDLSKHISFVKAQKLRDGTWGISAENHGGAPVIDERVPDSKLDDTVGKDLAAKIRSEVNAGEPMKMYRGLDLKVGGEGMKAFYDKIVPNVANDVLKKLGGGRVDDVTLGNKNPIMKFGDRGNGGGVLDAASRQQGFDITPSMRAKVREGQPLFVRDAADGNFDKVPDRELAPKVTGGKAAEAEQQFTKSGKPVSEAPDKLKPEWISKASSETQAFLEKAGVYVPKQTWRQRWSELKKDMGLKILQQTVDQYRPVLEKIGKYPYQLLRMASAHDAGLAALVSNGHVEMNKWGALRVKAGTQSFKDIMAPLAGEGDRMLAWMAAQRANELMKEGREHNFTQDEINAGLKLNTELHGEDKFRGEGTRAAAYTKAMKGFSEMNQSVLDVAEHAGILDPEARKAFSREFYVPFFREQDGEREVNPSNISGMVNQYATKRLKGGEEGLHDLMANTMQNWSHLLSASLKNNAAWQTLQHAEELGIATRIKAAEAGKGSVYVLQDGKEIHYIVHDQLVANAISSLGAVPMRGPIMRGLGMMKHALTVGTTWSPIFRIRHTIREQITALAANPTGYNPVKNWIDGFKYSSKNNPEYGNMAAGGAFFHMGLDLEGNRAAYVKRLIAHEIDPKSLVDSEHKALQMLGHMADWWKETGERSDSITRANLYRQTFARMVAEGHDAERAHFEASYVARDAMDYSLHGINPAIRMITQVVPFMNARMQGLYKLGRGAAEDPKRFAAVVGGITLATIALSLAQRKDKDIQNASEWDRDNNWLIKVGNVMYRVPKPFEVGAVATVADRALEAVMNGLHPSDRERFAARLMPILGAQLNLNPIPQALFPALELWANKNVFSGTQIEPGRDEKLSTAQHIGPNTSLTAQALGSAGILSPEQIDFAVGAYLGWVGTHVVNTVDLALRATGQYPTKAAPRLDDFFLIGDFAHQLPSNQSRFVEEYYQHMQKVQQAFGDMRMLQQTGQLQKATELMKSKGDEIGLHGIYLRTQREIGDLNRRGRYVQMSNMDADAKRVELDRLAQVKNSLATIAEKTRAQAVDNPQRTR